MTEELWLAATDPGLMLQYLRGKASDRKLRLFGCCCFELITTLPNRKAIRDALQAAEGFAEGLVTPEALKKAGAAARRVWQRAQEYEVAEIGLAAEQLCVDEGWFSTQGVYRLAEMKAVPTVRVRVHRLHADVLRDIIGNPFRPPSFDPDWRTGTAVQLARQMYDARDFGLMPLLADALEDAGCTDPDVLAHCRGDGPHVRGCWVVDLVLGKE